MSRRNRPAPERPTGSDVDPRSSQEIAASVRRKLLFALLAVAAVPTSVALSWSADQARVNLLKQLLPKGVSLDSPVQGIPNAPTVRDAIAVLGASPQGQILVDYEGHPILFRRDGKNLPYHDGSLPKTDETDPKTTPRILELNQSLPSDGSSEVKSSPIHPARERPHS